MSGWFFYYTEDNIMATAKLWNVSDTNAFSTTLNGTITDSDTSMTLTSVTGLNTGGGVLVLDRVNSGGTETPGQREFVTYTGITTKTLTGITRGVNNSTAQEHSSGAVIEETWTVVHVNDLNAFLEVAHDADGVIDSIPSGITLTSPVINTAISGTAFLDEDDMVSNSATKVASQQSIKAYVDPSVVTTASSATPTPTGATKYNELYITALAEAAELQTPSGSPVNGNKLLVRILDDATARALTYNPIDTGTLADLPDTTTISKTLYMLFLYNSSSVKWELATTGEAA